jgi:hypothetical protein
MVARHGAGLDAAIRHRGRDRRHFLGSRVHGRRGRTRARRRRDEIVAWLQAEEPEGAAIVGGGRRRGLRLPEAVGHRHPQRAHLCTLHRIAVLAVHLAGDHTAARQRKGQRRVLAVGEPQRPDRTGRALLPRPARKVSVAGHTHRVLAAGQGRKREPALRVGGRRPRYRQVRGTRRTRGAAARRRCGDDRRWRSRVTGRATGRRPGRPLQDHCCAGNGAAAGTRYDRARNGAGPDGNQPLARLAGRGTRRPRGALQIRIHLQHPLQHPALVSQSTCNDEQPASRIANGYDLRPERDERILSDIFGIGDTVSPLSRESQDEPRQFAPVNLGVRGCPPPRRRLASIIVDR